MLNAAAIWKNLNSPRRLFLIAGPCVIENEKLCRTVAASLVKTCKQLGIFYVFKASFDKANRTSGKAFRGPGIAAGLKTLAAIRADFGVPVLTASDPVEFRAHLARAFAADGPVIVEALLNSREYDAVVLKKDNA